uniref:Uncharacterized protein n=1 Tax=Rhizophora mucronata TaxID=61149 RepID=A0A2P2Q9D1_RHIMU
MLTNFSNLSNIRRKGSAQLGQLHHQSNLKYPFKQKSHWHMQKSRGSCKFS